MKTSAQNGTAKKQSAKPRLRRTPLKESELPSEVQEYRRKMREWQESFQPRAKRMAYIRKLCKRIAEAYHPEKIILFGSHAYGTPTPESDVDLLIVIDYQGHPIEQMQKIRAELELETPMDLLIRRPQEIIERLQDGDMFMIQICVRGKVLYENKHNGVNRI